MKITKTKAFAAILLAGAAAATPSLAFAALKVGDAAPSFATKAALAGKPYDFNLDAALKQGPVVLYFFPAAFTSGCTVEAHQFAQASDEFKKNGATLIGVTAGNIDRVAEFSVSECSNKFAVAADPGAAISKRYKSTMLASRTSYVIGPDHKIAYVYSALSPEKHVANTLAAVQALKARK
jgi:peroxiredoxin Q/BCP